jgi:hypothetical protein
MSKKYFIVTNYQNPETNNNTVHKVMNANGGFIIPAMQNLSINVDPNPQPIVFSVPRISYATPSSFPYLSNNNRNYLVGPPIIKSSNDNILLNFNTPDGNLGLRMPAYYGRPFINNLWSSGVVPLNTNSAAQKLGFNLNIPGYSPITAYLDYSKLGNIFNNIPNQYSNFDYLYNNQPIQFTDWYGRLNRLPIHSSEFKNVFPVKF